MSVLPHGEFFGKLKERQAKFFFGNTKGVGSEEGGDMQSKVKTSQKNICRINAFRS